MFLLVLGFARAATLCFGVAEGDKAKECAGGSIVTDFSKPLADDTNVILVKNWTCDWRREHQKSL